MSKQEVMHSAIREGRGEGILTPLSEITNADVVILWGCDWDTNNYDMSWINEKQIIVMNPKKIELADKADLYIPIREQTDIYLALLLVRFLYINSGHDEEFLEKYASEYEDFYELTQIIRIKSTLEMMDISLGALGDVLELINNKKVMILCGSGLQKHNNAFDTLRAIDGLSVMLGLFGKEGCGLICDDKNENHSSFCVKSAKVSNTKFSGFNTENGEFVFLDELEIKII